MTHEKQQLTIVVGVLEVLIDNTTGPHLGHLVSVEGLDLGELARRDTVATVLGEEHRNGVVGKLLGAVLVSGLRVGRVTAPGVDVVAEEVNSDSLALAVEEIGQVAPNGRDVSSGVTNTHGPVALAANVGLHIPHRRLDIRHAIGGSNAVGNLVTSEEAEGIVITSQGIDDAGVPVVERELPGRVTSIDGDGRVGEIGDNVDARIRKKLHAVVMVGGRVNGVGTNDVGAQLLQVGNITLAGGLVGQRISGITLWLVLAWDGRRGEATNVDRPHRGGS